VAGNHAAADVDGPTALGREAADHALDLAATLRLAV
jgi:hypothetical protein